MRASGWFSDEQEPLQEWIYISNIYGDMLALPNGLFGFLPTFYPQKSSNLTDSLTDTLDLCPKTFSAVANICKRWYIIMERNQ